MAQIPPINNKLNSEKLESNQTFDLELKGNNYQKQDNFYEYKNSQILLVFIFYENFIR